MWYSLLEAYVLMILEPQDGFYLAPRGSKLNKCFHWNYLKMSLLVNWIKTLNFYKIIGIVMVGITEN